MISATSDRIVAGPLIAKSGSTTLRCMFGNCDRPPTLKSPAQRRALDAIRFNFVRDPIEHLLASYMQRGWLNMGRYGEQPPIGERKVRLSSSDFCAYSLSRKFDHFKEYVKIYMNDTDTRKNEHIYRQSYWLSDYRLQNGVEISVLDDMDVVFNLENLHEQWSTFMQRLNLSNLDDRILQFFKKFSLPREPRAVRSHGTIGNSTTGFWIA